MVLEQALEIMRLYAVDQDQDDLTAVEHMVRNMKLLNPEQLEALDVFMAQIQNDYTSTTQAQLYRRFSMGSGLCCIPGQRWLLKGSGSQ